MIKTIVLFFMISFMFYAQTKVVYQVDTHFTEESFKDVNIGVYLKSAKELSEHIEYELIFNKNLSEFRQSNKMIPESIDFRNGSVILSTNKIFQKEGFSYLEDPQNMFPKNSFIVKRTHPSNWELTNESKIIENYLCFKAILRDSNLKNAIKVFVWFCPDIPYSFGPVGHGGLPGLILSVTEGNISYHAKKILFDVNEKPNFDLKGKEISNAEYQSKIEQIIFEED